MMKKQLGFSTSQTQMIIGLTLLAFAISMVFAGKLEKKIGARQLSIIGSIFLFLGYFLASIFGSDFFGMLFSISLFCGIGTGCCYVCCLVVPAKNFPLQKGLATGIAVGGFGAGAVLLSYLIKSIIASTPAISLLEIFNILSFIVGAILLFGSFLLQYEGMGKQAIATHTESVFSIKDKNFMIPFVTMFTGSFAGLLILGNAKPIALSLGYEDSIATFSITLLAFGNMFGRVFWGFTLDKIGVDRTLISAFMILLLSTLGINFIAPSQILLNVVLIGVGVGYSSIFVVFAAKTAQVYGVDKLGLVYPYIFLSYGVAGALGPVLGGFLFDMTQSYSSAIFISAALTFFGVVNYWKFSKKEA